jgi:ABC transport system ATP-binding/permease protein
MLGRGRGLFVSGIVGGMSATSLFNLIDGQLAYGDLPLLDRASLSLLSGERIGLIGRNGTGKSSLFAVISGDRALDDGEARRRDGLRVVLVEQEPVLPPAPTMRESLVMRGQLEALPDDRDRWRAESRLNEFMQRFDVDPDLDPAAASGGEAKRAALAVAFALEPELLLLDEPTNHLDIAGIELLEESLAKMPATIFITHDRHFLDRVATRIVELDRGMLRSYPGNFSAYQQAKAEQLASERVSQRRFDKFWAQEEVWIRKGVEARRTRNEGRVKRLETLRRERDERRERMGSLRLSLDSGERSGKLVAELVDVSKAFDGRPIVSGLTMTIARGDRIGLVGPNGIGKSTLLKLILGQMPPDAGHLRLGTQLQVAYFDQMREQLDPELSVAETISPGSDWVEVDGGRKHVMSYLGDFLFPPRRAQAPVKTLSGGERNRLLLARLFARPANLLVLDEPTNDLDLESIELLEDTLQAYTGTLLLVSHDRAFLDNVVTQVLASEGGGRWREYVGGYSDWVRQRPGAPGQGQAGSVGQGGQVGQVGRTGPSAAATASTPAAESKPRPKLSYKEQRELETLPARIQQLEAEQAALAAAQADPDYFRKGSRELRADQERTQQIESTLLELLERWESLEQRSRDRSDAAR